jgi:hypothetical protein
VDPFQEDVDFDRLLQEVHRAQLHGLHAKQEVQKPDPVCFSLTNIFLLSACLGQQGGALVQTCDPQRTEQMLAQDCDSLRTTLEGGKADGWFSDFMCSWNYYSYCDPEGEKAALGGIEGAWVLEKGEQEYWRPNGYVGCPPALKMIKIVDDNGVDFGMRVLTDSGEAGKYVYDRAEFTDINTGEMCSPVLHATAIEGLQVCYQTELTAPGQLEQRTRHRLKGGLGPVKPLPVASEVTYQRLSIDGDVLTYEYEYEGRTDNSFSCVFVRK